MAKLVRILSIDGGGIRGIIPGRVLTALEGKLQARFGAGAMIADHFDLIAGTSTGGILSCMLLCPDDPERSEPRPRFTAEQAVELYLDQGDDIFEVPLWHKIKSGGGLTDEKYPADGLDEALDDHLGKLKLHQLLRPSLITAYDIKRRDPFFFKQHRARRPDGSSNDGRNYLVRDVARATSAAPTYFEVARVKSLLGVPRPLVDGGVFANNPALCAYAEARKFFKKRAVQMCILSLGTGSSAKGYSYKEAKDWGLAGWAKPVIDIMMSGVSETVDYQLKQIYEAVGKPKQYLRIQADLTREPDSVSEMDNADRENLQRLDEIGRELADEHDAALDAFVKLLAPQDG